MFRPSGTPQYNPKFPKILINIERIRIPNLYLTITIQIEQNNIILDNYRRSLRTFGPMNHSVCLQ